MSAAINYARLSIDDASKTLAFCDSYSRLPALLEIRHQMAESDWLRLLGDEWSGFDNISHHIDGLIDSPLCWMFELGARVKHEMMTTAEQAAFNALPDTFTVYRGCHCVNKWGLSWTLSREIAEEFPTLNRYQRRDQQALLITAQVKKSEVIAVKLDREESEIITRHPKCISIRHIESE